MGKEICFHRICPIIMMAKNYRLQGFYYIYIYIYFFFFFFFLHV